MPGNGAVFSYMHWWKKYCSTSGIICGIPLPARDSFQYKYNLSRNALQLREAGSSGMLDAIQKQAAPQITVFKCFNKLI